MTTKSSKYILKLIQNLDVKGLKILHSHLKSIFEKEFQELIKAKELVPDQLWERYKLLQLTGLPEQVIFDKAHKKFKEKINEIQSERFTEALKRSTLEV